MTLIVCYNNVNEHTETAFVLYDFSSTYVFIPKSIDNITLKIEFYSTVENMDRDQPCVRLRDFRKISTDMFRTTFTFSIFFCAHSVLFTSSKIQLTKRFLIHRRK